MKLKDVIIEDTVTVDEKTTAEETALFQLYQSVCYTSDAVSQL